jgi:hypothetical protein
MCEKNPEIKISFNLVGQSGEVIDLDKLTECLAITPTRTRTLDDWPEAIKRPKISLPEDLKPRCYWTVELSYEDCSAVSSRFEEMTNILEGKEDIINLLRKEMHLKPHFEVVIAAHHDHLPEMLLAKTHIEFLEFIGAEIGFDMYLD